MSRPVVRLAVGILVTVILLAGAGGAFIWWKVSGLKEQLVHNLENSLGAKADITSLDFDVWKGELHAAGITLTNQRPTAPWETGAISQATMSFHLRDVFSSSIPLSVEVSSWNVILQPGAATSSQPSPASNSTVSPDSSSGSSPAQGRVHVTQLSAHDGSVEIDLSGGKKVLIHGVSFEASNNGAGVWTTQLQANSLEAGTLVAGASSIQIQGTRDKVTFSNLRMQCDQGFLTGDGNLALTDHHASTLDLKAVDIPVSMLVAVAWQMKLTGFASGDLHYEGNDQGGEAKGQFALSHGKFNVLPWLGKVTLLVGLQDITDVEVDKATTDFSWKDRTLHLTNLDVRKNDVIRVAGAVDVDPQSQVDGKLKLGLPSTVTAKWPQLQEKVFSVQLEDFNWTEVHLTGTPDHLQEDLTPRLLAVGEGQGTDIIDQTKQKALDLIKSFMGN